MSSRFNPSVTPRNKVPICISDAPKNLAKSIDGVPAALIAATWWVDKTVSPELALSQSVPLLYHQPTLTWSSLPKHLPTELKVIVTRLATPGQFDLFVELYKNGVMIDDLSWHNVFIDVGPPMRSLKFERHFVPGLAYIGLHLTS